MIKPKSHDEDWVTSHLTQEKLIIENSIPVMSPKSRSGMKMCAISRHSAKRYVRKIN